MMTVFGAIFLSIFGALFLGFMAGIWIDCRRCYHGTESNRRAASTEPAAEATDE